MESFAYYLSDSADVALITKKMWKVIAPAFFHSQLPPKSLTLTSQQNIDWCYIFYALQYQIAAILLATNPRWFLYQALGSNFLWILPWAIVVTKVKMSQEHAWTYYSIIFGGALVFDFFDVGIVVLFWAWRLMRGKITLRRVHSTL